MIGKRKTTDNKRTAVLILDNIRSIQNVGSIFRTADCAGILEIYLCGYTPAPVDRFGRKRKDFAKVSLGAEDSVAWKTVSDAANVVRKLKKDGFRIVAVEQDEASVDYRIAKPVFPLAVVYGSEVGGVSNEVLALCDEIVEIPLMGKKESLNVSVSVGISLFRLLDI